MDYDNDIEGRRETWDQLRSIGQQLTPIDAALLLEPTHDPKFGKQHPWRSGKCGWQWREAQRCLNDDGGDVN